MPLFNYLLVLVVPSLVAVGLVLGGWWTWLQSVVIYGLVPIIELFIGGTKHNVDPQQEAARAKHWLARLLLASVFPVQLALVAGLLWRADQFAGWELLGLIVGTGSSMGGVGINGAHELGHKRGALAKWMAEATLALTLYLHFSVEHNRGHHAKVATPEDPASARRGQTVYGFWVQSIWGSLRSAWTLERNRLAREGRSPWTLSNALLRALLSQCVLIGIIASFVSPRTLGAFVLASMVSILHLETVNYLQHYGLSRARLANGSFERVDARHSWTSNHPISRALLLDLPRHADHHAAAGRHFTNLRHLPDSPVLPTGYPGLLLLALIPPLFMGVMHKQPALRQAPAS